MLKGLTKNKQKSETQEFLTQLGKIAARYAYIDNRYFHCFANCAVEQGGFLQGITAQVSIPRGYCSFHEVITCSCGWEIGKHYSD